jgi:peptidoglycan/LPS O-acetylase OafA/YrhL
MPLDTRNRIPSLDGLRAISIACVLLAHLSGTRNFFRSYVFELYGNFGVRVFFVISGYLITSLLLKEHARIGSISLRELYLRRAYRILPAAYTFMVVVIAAHWRALSWPNILTRSPTPATTITAATGCWGISGPCPSKNSSICSGR